jgi:hypothetical protein
LVNEIFRKGDHQVGIQITQDDAGEKRYVCTHHTGERQAFSIPLTQDQYSATVFRLLTLGYKAVW